ncbi:DgyrCDS13878 [Dimorphilus gyrociliatus]|uniref:DgyrCDS13878 n=1 Tax=Dimorphilus gyrociliatus TaxID=2664684 RepID=A0A7I8WBY7_9ANNE|nr:DgyrCDS13878 [Dimorphilus gyrociliatus]
MLLKEYRICMPLSVKEYRIGQLYMIAKHSLEQSEKGQGVEVIANKPCHDPKHGDGQYTEKRIHLSKFSIAIETAYEDNPGTTENCINLEDDDLAKREIVHIDIVHDQYPDKHYKKEEDPKNFQSKKTNRGPISEKNWRETHQPIMCSYKVVKVFFEVWGFQTRVEQYVHSCIQEILLVGHRQAYAWIDEWVGMTMEDLRKYEKDMHDCTNRKVLEDTEIAPNEGAAL